MFYNTDSNVRKIEVGSELNHLGAEQNCITNTQTNGNEEVNQEAQPNGRSNCLYFGIFVGVSLFLTLISIVTLLVIYYTRKENKDMTSIPYQVSDNGTMCYSKNFANIQNGIEKWLYSVDDNTEFEYRPTKQCYSNLTCVQNSIMKYSNNYDICNGLYYFPGIFGLAFSNMKCDAIHIAFNDDKLCNTSVIGYFTEENRDLFLCPEFILNITNNPDVYMKIDLMNVFFAKSIYNDSQRIVEANSTLAGASCNSFAYNADSSPSYNESAILCMTELYLACN